MNEWHLVYLFWAGILLLLTYEMGRKRPPPKPKDIGGDMMME